MELKLLTAVEAGDDTLVSTNHAMTKKGNHARRNMLLRYYVTMLLGLTHAWEPDTA